MERLSNTTVKLTDWEIAAHDRFEDLLDLGRGIKQAATQTKIEFPGLSDEFVEWLER